MPQLVSSAAMECGVMPSRNRWKMSRTVSARSGLTTILPVSLSLSSPRKRLYAKLTLPSAIRLRCPQVTFSVSRSYKAFSNVALVAAILSAPVAVNVKFLTAMRASEIVDRLALHPIEMAVPPLVPAFVTAEAFFLPFCNLLNLPSAVPAGGCFARERHGSFGSQVSAHVISAAERLHCVQRYAKRPVNAAVAIPGGAQLYDLWFLIVGHNPSASSEG